MNAGQSIGFALVGAGRIGSFHAECIARRVYGAHLVAIGDPAPMAAAALAEKLGCGEPYTDVAAAIRRDDVGAVIIATPARFHTGMVELAAAAGKAVFCEKPMALTLQEADRAIAAATKANVRLQVGFNRRWDRSFVEGKAAIEAGRIGTIQLMRSLTRDPGPWGADPARIPQWTIFYETLIHDFDTLLWLNAGDRPIEVHAMADALVRPDAKAPGRVDTAVATIRFAGGALAVAEANFSAMYGYDIRGEVFGSGGMVTMGDVRRSSLRLFDRDGVSADTWRMDTHHFVDAYTAEFQHFVDRIGTQADGAPGGHDARNALAIALAGIESVKQQRVVRLTEVTGG